MSSEKISVGDTIKGYYLVDDPEQFITNSVETYTVEDYLSELFIRICTIILLSLIVSMLIAGILEIKGII